MTLIRINLFVQKSRIREDGKRSKDVLAPGAPQALEFRVDFADEGSERSLKRELKSL